MSSTTISIRVDSDLKNEADKLFNELGLNLSSAVNIFLRQAIREQSIPFKISLNTKDRIMDKYDPAFKELASGEMTKEDFKTFIENKIISD